MPDTFDRLKAALADRYAIEREIGRGGMATVYLGEDRKHRRRVAVKVLKPELAATLGAERFLREIEIAAQLNQRYSVSRWAGGLLVLMVVLTGVASWADQERRATSWQSGIGRSAGRPQRDTILGARTTVEPTGGPSFSPVELVPQPHGGALKAGGTPGNAGGGAGGRVHAERRRARMQRSEAINDAVTGHIEKLSAIIGDLVEEAGGEQYRCPQCGSFGPKVSDH